MFRIVGSGIALPERLVTNEDLFARYGRKSLEPVLAALGHGARYYCGAQECSADLAVRAAEDAIRGAAVLPLDIDLVILATDTPSHLSPATVFQVMHRLGARRASGFDVNSACSGFVSAMDIAARYLAGDQYKTVLVIGTYAMSKFLDPDDGVTSPLFGDGAGALLLRREPSNDGRSYSGVLRANSEYWDCMGIYGGGTKYPMSEAVLAEKKHFVKFPKNYPLTVNRETWPILIVETLARIDKTVADVDWFIFTQIRKTTIQEVLEAWNLSMDRTHTVMDKWGYTGSACIPMAFHDAIESGKIKRGDRVVFCASGGGFSRSCVTFVY